MATLSTTRPRRSATATPTASDFEAQYLIDTIESMLVPSPDTWTQETIDAADQLLVRLEAIGHAATADQLLERLMAGVLRRRERSTRKGCPNKAR